MSQLDHSPTGGIGPEHGGPLLVIPSAERKPSKWDLWRNRVLLIVFVLFSLEIGIILTVAPWTPFWADNSLLADYPQLREFLMRNFIRGLVSGLGLTDILLAVSEAVGYRESVD